MASGDKVRHMTVKPWMAAIAFCFAGVFTIGYLSATSYLVVRDGLIGASLTRQARMQREYEDRIAALRAQVDKITSRQLLDQQVVEQKVEKLLERQNALSDRHGRIDSLIERAGLVDSDVPIPEDNPRRVSELDDKASAGDAIDTLLGKKRERIEAPVSAYTSPLGYAPLRETNADKAEQVFSRVTRSLKSIERDQLYRIQSLTVGATQTASAIQDILSETGFSNIADVEDKSSAIGGPYLAPEPLDAPDEIDPFNQQLDALDSALERLEKVKTQARHLPFANPAPGAQITSRFGNRVDPFFHKLAMHAGIDFRERVGAPVRSTGAGTVITAGRAGGYGIMVEIRHKNGVTTRYGHLSQTLVKVGQQVDAGDIIAKSGNTGRSTGPHLHYEVRLNGKAVNPIKFLNAGLKLDTYL
nr:peptidoglycan DD-metalloendopeptidase family protein [Rhizobium sp. L1K21]